MKRLVLLVQLCLQMEVEEEAFCESARAVLQRWKRDLRYTVVNHWKADLGYLTRYISGEPGL